MLTLSDLNPGDTFVFDGDPKYMRWAVIETPPTWKNFMRDQDKTFCLMTKKYRMSLKSVPGHIQAIAYPNEVIVKSVSRKK